MAHEWDRGVLNQSSWHGLEEIGVFSDAASMIDHGERTGAWPVSVGMATLTAFLESAGVRLPVRDERAVVASYRNEVPRVVGINGGRYTATTPESWHSLVDAAVEAGAKPTGAFSLRDGRIVIGTFQVNGNQGGIVTNLLLADSFDGSSKLTVGTTSVRVVCANTLAASMRSDGAGMAQLRHSGDLAQKVQVLKGEIAGALKTGETLREMFRKAQDTTLDRARAQAVFDALFPEAPADSAPGVVTRAENARSDARKAMAFAENALGPNLATLWNAATYLIDRDATGTARALRSGDRLDSLLFGTRGKRVAEVQAVIADVMA